MAHRKGVVRYRENPFVTHDSVVTRRKRVTVSTSRKAVLDLDTGELEHTAEIVAIREVDSEQFVKLFTQNLRMFFDLSPTTMKLVPVLLSQVQRHPNTDRVMLNLNVAQNYFNDAKMSVSKASFHRSVKELLDKQFIAETVLAGLFFINPNLFFNGDRVRFVNEVRRKRANGEHTQLVDKTQSDELGTQEQPALTVDQPAAELDPVPVWASSVSE